MKYFLFNVALATAAIRLGRFLGEHFNFDLFYTGFFTGILLCACFRLVDMEWAS